MIYCRKHIERRVAMPVSYDKLWKLLIDKKMNRTDLHEYYAAYGFWISDVV